MTKNIHSSPNWTGQTDSAGVCNYVFDLLNALERSVIGKWGDGDA